MTLEQYGGGVVCRYLARATRVIVASYKNEEASIFHRPTTAFSPISNETLPAPRWSSPGAEKSNSLAAGSADPGTSEQFCQRCAGSQAIQDRNNRRRIS